MAGIVFAKFTKPGNRAETLLFREGAIWAKLSWYYGKSFTQNVQYLDYYQIDASIQ